MAPFMEGTAVADILQNIRKSDIYQACYQFLHGSQLKDWYIASGFVQQTYYNARHGLGIHNAIKDIDIVYFDEDQPADSEREHRIEGELTQLLKSRLKVDVKNQANVHTFYLEKFGYAIEPHKDIFSAIDSFPTTSTTIGITAGIHEERIYATYGLDDLCSLVLKPNKKQRGIHLTQPLLGGELMGARENAHASWPSSSTTIPEHRETAWPLPLAAIPQDVRLYGSWERKAPISTARADATAAHPRPVADLINTLGDWGCIWLSKVDTPKKQITKEIYEAKRKRVEANWPLVRIEEWGS